MLWRKRGTPRRTQAEEFHRLRERGSWSPNGRRRTWNIMPLLPTPSSCRPLVLFIILLVVAGTAGASALVEYVGAAKLAKAEEVLRDMATEEGWSDDRLELLINRLHTKYGR